MANTKIQIKRSSATSTPVDGSLSAGELAYSYNSEKLFLGTANGLNVQEIGGRYWLDLTLQAFERANSGNGLGAIAYNQANAAFASANAANDYAAAVGVSANLYAAAVGVSANVYSAAVGVSANSYAAAVGVSANSYASAVGVSANSYADFVGASANAYTAATYYAKTGGVISGDVIVTGNVSIAKDLNVTGNVTFTNTTSLVVSDPLLYLAGNNYTSDIVDIGFVGNYNNGSANLHTGLYREHSNKQYYLFQNYNQEPDNNHIDPTANGFQLAVLNADIITGNLFLGGINAAPWIAAAFDKANSANVLAYNTGIGANAYASAVGVSANLYADTKVSSVTGTAGQIFSSGGTTPTLNLISTGVTATTYGGATQIPVFTVDSFGRLTSAANVAVQGMDYEYVNAATVSANSYAAAVGVSANSYAALVAGYANTNASNGSYISTGVVGVAYGGTGNTTFLANSVLIGNGTSPVWGLKSTTEGHLLQISAAGAPQFAMLDGGSF